MGTSSQIGFVQAAVQLFANLMHQPSLDRVTRNRSSVLILLGVWLAGCAIFTIYFDASLKIMLTLPLRRQPPVRTLSEAAKAVRNGWTLAVFDPGMSPSTFCSTEQCPELTELENRRRVFPLSETRKMESTVFADPEKRTFAIVNGLDGTPVVYVTFNPPLFTVVDREILPHWIAFALSKLNRIVGDCGDTWRRNLHREREMLNQALALVNPAFQGSFGQKYDFKSIEFKTTMDARYGEHIHFQQYRLVLVFFGVVWLITVGVLFLEITVGYFRVPSF